MFSKRKAMRHGASRSGDELDASFAFAGSYSPTLRFEFLGMHNLDRPAAFRREWGVNSS
jgi:hypothetical protein